MNALLGSSGALLDGVGSVVSYSTDCSGRFHTELTGRLRKEVSCGRLLVFESLLREYSRVPSSCNDATQVEHTLLDTIKRTQPMSPNRAPLASKCRTCELAVASPSTAGNHLPQIPLAGNATRLEGDDVDHLFARPSPFNVSDRLLMISICVPLRSAECRFGDRRIGVESYGGDDPVRANGIVVSAGLDLGTSELAATFQLPPPVLVEVMSPVCGFALASGTVPNTAKC